ncbi:MAG TPA: glycosyl transferase family 1, partial [Arthrobacter sp.]|nr:glycosyl transferase family 1 [Arthrobacter sp.]
MRPIRLLVPGNIRYSSGGNVYNARLVDGLQALGAEVEVVPVEGNWPDAGAKERRRLATLLGAWEPSAVAGQRVAMVDGLVAVGAPDELELAAKAGRETWVLDHMPVAESSGAAALKREARALRAATGLICTSTS